MKDVNQLEIIELENTKIIEDSVFIKKIKTSSRLSQYIELEKLREEKLAQIIKNYEIKEETVSVVNCINNIRKVNIGNEIKDSIIRYGQQYNLDFKDSQVLIIDIKKYAEYFEKIKEYKFSFEKIGITQKNIKVILNCSSKFDSHFEPEFLLYIISNRQKEDKEDINLDNLFKLWNVTKKYYPKREYIIYTRMYEELFIKYLIDNYEEQFREELIKYIELKEKMSKIKNEIMEEN